MIKRIVIPSCYGQTCNQLFQISHWIPLAKKLGVPLYFPGFRKYSHLFEGTSDQRFPYFSVVGSNIGFMETKLASLYSSLGLLSDKLVKPIFPALRFLPGIATFARDNESSNINPVKVVGDYRASAGSLWVRGWLYRDYAGLIAEKPTIKKFFSPISRIREYVGGCINSARQSDVLLVGVHLRRGDYKKWVGGKYYYDDFVVSGLKKVLGVFPDRKVRFLLVSNEPVNLAHYKDFDVVPGLGAGGGGAMGDLYALASCDYIMGPPSTFTGWASFFGDVPLYVIKDPASSFSMASFSICNG